MRKITTTIITVLALLAIVVAPVAAITGNYVKDFDHPFVGMIAFYDANGDFIWRCSGSLISPTVVLTAGHCADTADGAVSARVWFQQDAGVNYNPVTQQDPITGYPDSCAKGTLGTLCATSKNIYNYGFANFAGFPNTHDAGIVVLKQSISMPEYGILPDAGLLNDLATSRGLVDTIFTVSGYGLSYSNEWQNGKPNLSFRERLMAESTLVNLDSMNTDGYNIQTQGNGDDRGGTCSGDSGGPVFLGGPDSNVIVAVTSFGMNSICRGTDYAYRVDQAAVLAWIGTFLH